tara:strand:- start:317 stop:610 length:294 start_codon:yes stop_codon:yes gene_type:complete
MPIGVAVKDCTGAYHLSVKKRVLTDEAQKISTKPIGPVHHWSNTKSSINFQVPNSLFVRFHWFLLTISRCYFKIKRNLLFLGYLPFGLKSMPIDDYF